MMVHLYPLQVKSASYGYTPEFKGHRKKMCFLAESERMKQRDQFRQ